MDLFFINNDELRQRQIEIQNQLEMEKEESDYIDPSTNPFGVKEISSVTLLLTPSVENVKILFLDTETTGLSFQNDRIVSFGAVLFDSVSQTREEIELFFNPGMPCPAEAFRVHGLTDEFLAQQPDFGEHALYIKGLLESADYWIAQALDFDLRMIDAEFRRFDINFNSEISSRRFCTKEYAELALPGLPNHRLDTLCDQFGIDRSHRDLHGALKDAKLVEQVFYMLKHHIHE